MQNFSAFSSNLVYPGDYTEYKCVSGTVTLTDGTAVTVYAPESGDQAGYDVFPETVSISVPSMSMKMTFFFVMSIIFCLKCLIIIRGIRGVRLELHEY